MHKASIGKILMALSIACVYIYLFGIVQVITVSADTEVQPIILSISEATTPQTTQKTPEATTIRLENDKKPALADRKEQTTAETTATTTETTTEKIVIRPPETATTQTEAPQTTPQTEPLQTTEPIPVETVIETTTTTSATTTITQTDSEPTSDPDPTGEQFTVRDHLTGSFYTGSAREIVARALVGEISNWFPDEAIKAQAVAEYTYIKKENMRGNSPTTALRTAAEGVDDRIYRLVDEVLGEAIYYNGEMIQCVFFASSCGYTNSSLNVWGVDYPYLRSVDCPLDASTDPNWADTDSYSSEYIKNAVQSTLGINLTGDPSTWFKINSRLDNRDHGWITSLSVGGMTVANGKNIDGRTMRETVLNYSLKSAAFELEYDKTADEFIFTTYGYGHGVGLSQWGAKALAENGYNYKQILQHYFTGAEVY